METVEVHLDHKTARIGYTSREVWKALRKFWSFYPKGYRYSPKFKIWLRARADDPECPEEELPGWNGQIQLFKYSQVPAGLFRATYKEAQAKAGVRFRIIYERQPFHSIGNSSNGDEKYHFQQECVDKMITAYPKGGGIVLNATGTGKTRIASVLFSRLPDYSCLFVVDQLNLLEQARTAIAKWTGERVGIVGKSQFIPARITVATIQTLKIHTSDQLFWEWFGRVKVVIVDELHDMMAKRNFDILEEINPVARYGLTATLQLKQKPVRMKAYSFCGPVLYEYPLAQGIEEGVLSSGRVLQLLFPGGDGDGDWQEDYMSQVEDNYQKHDAWLEIMGYLHGKGKFIMTLVERLFHLHTLSGEAEDVPHFLAYGGVKQKARRKAKRKFEAGDTRLLIANRVMKKGVDIKRVDVVMDLAEMKSQNDAQQKFGRGVRLHPDKTELLYIDFGSQEGRFRKNARSRASALRKLEIPVKVVKVSGVEQALKEVKKFCLQK